ncbi:MAG: C45 family autoproteolytic acyltransferase/hydrolase, partial [bacterium]|nr:C45 family autoproteolytic acyltransferase/hydrolase [bacterium]
DLIYGLPCSTFIIEWSILMTWPLLIELSGSAEERGFAYGEQAQSFIERAYSLYVPAFGLSENVLRLAVEPYAEIIARYCPELMAELVAISRGAGLELWKILALNCRTEIIRRSAVILAAEINQKEINRLPGECTVIAARQHPLLCQTWDWITGMEELMVLLRVDTEEGPSIVTFTEPGVLGKIGLSSNGLALSLNILAGIIPEPGLPTHVLVRRLLGCATPDEAQEFLSIVPLGAISCITMLWRDYGLYQLEVAGSRFDFRRITDDFYVHTNHFLALPIENSETEFASSYARLKRMYELAPVSSIKQSELFLGDSCGDYPVCSSPKPDTLLQAGTEVEIATLARLVMDVEQGTMSLRRGWRSDAEELGYRV